MESFYLEAETDLAARSRARKLEKELFDVSLTTGGRKKMENEAGASSVPVDHRTTTTSSDSTASSSSPAMVEPSPGGPAASGKGTPQILGEWRAWVVLRVGYQHFIILP